MRRVAATALLASALVVAGRARANEADTYGLGSRSSAMGSAMAADATDFSANYYNPAGLVGARGPSISIGYVYAWNHLKTNGLDNGVANVHGIVGGIALPGTLFKIPFAFGVGLYLPDAGISRVNALTQDTPRWALYDERASIIYIAANLAVRPLPWLEVGGGVGFLAGTKGTFNISGTADLSNNYDSQLRHEVNADLAAVRYPQVGARFAIPGFGYLGAVYRGQTKIDLSLTAHLKGTVLYDSIAVPLSYNLATTTSDAFLPQQVVLGLSFQRIERLHVNFDVTFVNWAAYQSPTAVTTSDLSIQVPQGVGISVPPSPKPVSVIPPGFSNRFVPRIGVEYVIPAAGGHRTLAGDPIDRRLLEIPIRAGYVYEKTPVPSQPGITNFEDADRHTVSWGAGLTLNAPGAVLSGSVTLDFHGQASILPSRSTQKASPADFVGDYTASGTMLGLGSTLTVVF